MLPVIALVGRPNVGKSTLFNRLTRSRDALVAEWKRLDATFLALLGFGAVAAIWSTSFLMSYLLSHQYTPTLAFFIGLILPSVVIPWGMMEKRGIALAPVSALAVRRER